MEKSYIVIYAEDFDQDIWEDYCKICGVSTDCTYIKIKFLPEEVEGE